MQVMKGNWTPKLTSALTMYSVKSVRKSFKNKSTNEQTNKRADKAIEDWELYVLLLRKFMMIHGKKIQNTKATHLFTPL